MITGLQIRSARAALGWSARRLSERARVSLRTIIRLEEVDGLPSSRVATLREIQRAFETAGIEFIGAPEDAPGIRVRIAQGKER